MHVQVMYTKQVPDSCVVSAGLLGARVAPRVLGQALFAAQGASATLAGALHGQ